MGTLYNKGIMTYDTKKSGVISEWSDDFDEAGFGNYGIDLSYIPSDLIERLGKVCRDYNNEKSEEEKT